MYDGIIFPRTFSTSIEMPESGYNNQDSVQTNVSAASFRHLSEYLLR